MKIHNVALVREVLFFEDFSNCVTARSSMKFHKIPPNSVKFHRIPPQFMHKLLKINECSQREGVEFFLKKFLRVNIPAHPTSLRLISKPTPFSPPDSHKNPRHFASFAKFRFR